ncbi:tetratricopeptide repeat protein [Micromonospora sp. WMMD998]|uniref:tetratricopeptide repeat protein n=1 Tax=Micromonospora sp. WMMD998 TaxID=3016092 RepID=UPI00249CEDB6|nr:tetratricopeptide repeat protein [Micromonospora sp. WMMD998]WFE41200.1 tetratricopeptide repeat protein [Micromonospora sp. WMMD998]
MTGSVVFGDVIQISHIDGDVTVISPDRPPYRVSTADSCPVPVGVPKARSHPSCLLLARHQVVPFTGRERTLDALAEWVRGGEPVAALLVHGAGGQGKTRLAAEVAARCAEAGWAVWKVVHTPTPVPGTAPVSRVELPGGAVLAVVDYADRWPASALLALLIQLRDLYTRTGARVRVLMLARSDGYWWPAVANRAESDLGIDTGQVVLPPLAADSDDDRPTLFTTAADRFAAAMNIERVGWPVPDLTGPAFAQVLAVHMAALATVDAIRHGDVPPVRGDAVSAYLLVREEAYWHELCTGPEGPLTTPPAVMHRAVYTATLIGAQPRSAARRALTQAAFAADSTAADRIIDDHTTCYPPTDTRLVFEPLHPDRLGEDLIALSTPGHGGRVTLEKDWAPIAVADLLTADGPQPPAWTTAAVTTLVETACRWPHIATDVLYPLIRRRPELVVAAGGATLTRLAAVPDVDPAVLEILEPLLPQGRHIDLDIAAAAITGHLTRHRLAHATDDAERARLHVIHAWRLANAGQHIAALASAQEAVGIYRRLAEANPGSLPGLAMSLNNLGNHLSGAGRRKEALAPTEEAAGIWRRLAMVNPAVYLPHLSGALNNLGNHLSGVGRREEALAPAEEAVAIRRRLAKADPEAYLPDLAGSLANLGSRLAEVGRREEALAPTEEAAGVYRRLAEADPAAHLPDFATSLHNLGNELSGVGRREEALAPAEEAVTIRRRLAEANPAAHLPDLAMSLTGLGARLLALGRREEALAPAEEAVAIRRRLAEANPAAHLPDLATSLNNLGVFLAEVGRREEALALAEEAAGIWRRLAEANPAAHLPDLATSLLNFSERLSQVGRREEALVPAEEATGIWRRLAEANPAAYLPQLAGSLDNLGSRLAEVGREEALVPAEEAMTIRRHLAEVNPAVYLSHLAISLSNRGALLFTAGCRDEALSLAEEAVGVYRRLADANPAAHLPELALSLNNLGVLLSESEQQEQALAAAEEATAIHRRLAGDNPAAYLPHLAMSLTNVSERLSRVGRREEALAAAEEAVTIRRRLAEVNPVAYLPFLARSLSAYARVCVSVDADMTGALAAVTEAAVLYEPLARQLPQVFADYLSDARQIRADIIERLGGEPEH